ncbi:MAG: hypothetical protein ACO3IT_09640, partial [Ilumatobacteraceae bacterium]
MNCPLCDGVTHIYTTVNKGDMIHRWRRCTSCPHRFRTIAPWLDSKNESIHVGPARHPKGTDHANSVFTADDVRAIREERAKGRSLVALSIKYGVHIDTISRICLRKSYRHVD